MFDGIKYFSRLSFHDHALFSDKVHQMESHALIMFIVKGTGFFYVSSECITVHENMLILIPPYQNHSGLSSDDPDFLAYVCMIDKGKYPLAYDEVIYLDTDRYSGLIYEMMKYLEVFHGNFQNTSRNSALTSLPSLFSEMVGDLLHNRIHLQNPSKKKEWLIQLISYIDEHYTEEISLEDLSIRYKYSAPHISHEFKKKTGISVHQYINKCRLGKAEMLLLTSKLSIREIAEICGFSSINYFSSFFKEHYDLSPGEYRNHIQNFVEPNLFE